MPNLTALSVTAPAAESFIGVQPYQHGFYLTPFPTSGAAATFTEADNYAGVIVGAVPFATTADAEELVFLSGARQRGDTTISVDDQTVRMQVFRGQSLFNRIYDRLTTRTNGPAPGERLAFARTYPDGSAIQGRAQIVDMVGESDPGAAAFGWDVVISFDNEFDWVDVRDAPTAGAVAPTGGAIGTVVTSNGTYLSRITAARFQTAAGVVTATQSTFSAKSDTQLKFAVPSGLAAATTYNVVLVYDTGTVGAGTFAVT